MGTLVPISKLRAALIFGHTEQDGTFILEEPANTVGRGLRIIELGDPVAPPVGGLTADGTEFRGVTRLGSFAISNSDLLMPETFDGLVPRALVAHGSYSMLENDWNKFFHNFIEQQFFGGRSVSIPGFGGEILNDYRAYQASRPLLFGLVRTEAPILAFQTPLNQFSIDTTFLRERFHVPEAHADSTAAADGGNSDAESLPDLNRSPSISESDSDIFFDAIDHLGFGDGTFLDDQCLKKKRGLGGMQQFTRRGQCSANQKAVLQYKQAPKSLLQIRTGGLSQSIVSVGGSALIVAGVVGLIVLPAFIILDFINGEYKAAAWSIGSIAAGIATNVAVTAALAGATIAGISVAGPIGVFVGTVVSLLFAIIPGLFKTTHHANSGNVTQIIQYAFFNDATHTGNERCNDNLLKNKQTPNCTVTYGAGAIADRFGWNDYDAVSFLITINQGYTMSIPDMAANITLYDHSNPESTANDIAYIDCGLSICRNDDALISAPCVPSDNYACSKPRFVFNRTLITFPVLNKTANDVYNLIESGECKIVADPIEGQIVYSSNATGIIEGSGATVPLYFNQTYLLEYSTASMNASTTTSVKNNASFNVYAGPINASVPLHFNYTGPAHNITKVTSHLDMDANWTASIAPFQTWADVPAPPINFTGQPVYIACNLTKDRTNVTAPNYNETRLMIVNNPNSSTNGQTTAYIPPPAPIPFHTLSAADSVCFSSSKTPATQWCLPNGTYTTNYAGAFGFKTINFDLLSLSSNAITVTLGLVQVIDGTGHDITLNGNFNANITAQQENGGLGPSLTMLTSEQGSLSIVIPPGIKSAPAMCLYSAPKFQGDVYCLGIGGTNFTSNLVNRAQSITLTPGVAAWLYPGYYGSPQGTYISTSVADLGGIPYLTGSSFKNMVAAAWIYDATVKGG